MPQVIPVLKDEEDEQPVPTLWRGTLSEIVDALKNGDYGLKDIRDVEPLDAETEEAISRNIEGYGLTLVSLPAECWQSSVCRWLDGFWEVLVDLFTAEEGLSDLVLHSNVFEESGGFRFEVHLVYVP
ncbi:MAG: hypothetical protein JWN66_2141 [Sphingomonas bacterium]|uniref:DUF7668 domain-containing protein n=1 Tax=Sphingomonas bacterium TaxID=1895847 RepID=UPI00261925E1|nr:hypothetical protein [Sphingomonas bacterium]MDB5705025.1 hypothetical protein [Sphingomonas bacterium]